MFRPQSNNNDDGYTGMERLRLIYMMMAPDADDIFSRSNTLQKGN